MSKAKFSALVVLTLALGFSWALSAEGAAVYDAYASARLEITGFFDQNGLPIARPPMMGISGNAYVTSEFAHQTGSAVVSKDAVTLVNALDPTYLLLGDGTEQEATAAGIAVSPPDSIGNSGIYTWGQISLSAGFDPVTIGFTLHYAYHADASVVNPSAQVAVAETTIELGNSFGNPLNSLSELIYAYSDTRTGGGRIEDSGSIDFQVALDPFVAGGQWETIFVYCNAVGHADSSGTIIPEPGGLTIWGIGILAVLGCGWRRRKRLAL